MADQIIPEKPDLFQPKIQKKPAQPVQPKPIIQIRRPVQAVRKPAQEKPQEEEKPIFNIPETQEQPAAEQTIAGQTPSNKLGWKRWLIIFAAAIIIVGGLGYYFLKG